MSSTDPSSGNERTDAQIDEPAMEAEAQPATELTVEDALAVAVAMLRGGDVDAGATLCERVLDAAPRILRLQNRPQQALAAFKQAMLVRPHHPDGCRGLGDAFHALGHLEEAAEVYRRWLQVEPESAYARHMLAACSGQQVPDRATDEFVAATFDRFAASFDRVLAGLQYQAPALIQQALEEYLGPGAADRDVADAGCGTGLCGSFLRGRARHLCGVDLSPAMIARARQREHAGGPLYDELLVDELTRFFQARPQAFDVIVSADTLCYFGRLDEPVAAMARSLRQGGVVAFTVEQAPEDAPEGFMLAPHGRYSQSETYLRETLKDGGLVPKLVHSVTLRMENGEPVRGLLVLAKKRSARRTKGDAYDG